MLPIRVSPSDMTFFSSLFDPFPPAVPYADVQVLPFLLLAVGLLIASFFLSRWARSNPNPITKKLTKAWPKAAFVFGFAALILVVSRVEGIQYLAMPFLWVVWGLLGILYFLLQRRVFRSRHYEVVKTEHVEDPRERYLPKKKK